MTRIIAGRFQTSEEANHAASLLAQRSVARDRVSVFYVTPPGQHDATPVGGDEQASPGLQNVGKGAGAGAAVGVAVGAAGALIAATAGLAAPVIAVAGIGAAAAGAYGGSFAGAMSATEDPGKSLIRHAGMMIAVDAGAAAAAGATDESAIVALLREAGALDIEEAEGTWASGTWEDFDATSAPHLVDGPKVRVSNPDASN